MWIREGRTETACIAAATPVTVSEPSSPSEPTVSNIIQPTCATVSGAIHFTPQVGVEYSVGSGFQSDEAFSALTPGSYTLTVRTVPYTHLRAHETRRNIV